MVNHCPGLLVFRPQEDGNEFSGGVISEIEFFQKLAASDETRRMVVIHDGHDIPLIVERVLNGQIVDERLAVNVASKFVSDNAEARLNRSVSPADVSRLVMFADLKTSQLSARTFTRSAPVQLFIDAWTAAAEVVLLSELNGMSTPHPWCRVVVGDTGSAEVLKRAAGWFHSGTEDKKTADLMPDNFVSREDLTRVASSLAARQGAEASLFDVA